MSSSTSCAKRITWQGCIWATIAVGLAACQIAAQTPKNDRTPPVDPPRYRYQLHSYGQGGVVVDGVAYFTADDFMPDDSPRDAQFPRVAAFDVRTLKLIRTYPFALTYDSTPLVTKKRDGTWLVLAHEHKNARTVAMNRDTAAVEWISQPNEPGNLFFGYSYFVQPTGAKLILMSCRNGLHALSSETGEDVWWHRVRTVGGVTPCVDQANGWVYYQTDGKIFKLNAADGKVLATTSVPAPNQSVSWNTILINDDHGYFVATYWYGQPEWDSAIRVYDKQLELVWEKTRLPIGRKATLTYEDGKLLSGCGNHWEANYQGDEWKHVAAYKIRTGDEIWRCNLPLKAKQYIANLPCFNGCVYAESQSFDITTPSQLFRIDTKSGALQDTITFDHGTCSCAQSIVARGKFLSGDLFGDGVAVVKIADNSNFDWPGPFGDPRTNQMAVPNETSAHLTPMKQLGLQQNK